MRKLILAIALFTLTLPLQAQHDTTLIKQCYAGYKNAVLSDKGKEAVEFVDSRTIHYYSDILNKTRILDSIGVDKQTILDKLTILMLRHRATKEEIMHLDGRSLFVYAIERGMIGKNSVQQLSLGFIDINGNEALAEVIVGNKTTPLAFKFYKESGAWKMSIISVMPAGNAAMKQVIKDSKKGENEFLINLLENVSENEVSPDIWKPLKN